VPWLRKVWEVWRLSILSDDEGGYYVKWARRPGLLRITGKRCGPRRVQKLRS
jgi:hypothetical protein